MNPEIEKCEAFRKIRGHIKMEYSCGNLKDVHIKKFLKDYYDGSPHDMLKGSNKMALLEDYILIHEALVGDDLQVHGFKTLYKRHNLDHCCGTMNEILPNGKSFCEVCGSEY